MKTALVNLINPYLMSDEGAANSSSLSCKFVMIREDETLNMVIGNVERYPYHAGLIFQFCKEHQIKVRWVKRPDVVQVYDRSVAVLGGGWVEILPESKSCRVYGRSNAYGQFVPEDVQAVLAGRTLLSGYAVTVE